MSKKKTRRTGRPSKYESHVEHRMSEIKNWRRNGYTEEQISKLVGVAYSTFKDYKNNYPDLRDALKESKELLVSDLEDSLFQIAMGTKTAKTTRIKKEYNYRTGKMEVVEENIEIREYLPNTTALIFALKNLDFNSWKDRRDSTIEINNFAEDNFKTVTDQIMKNLITDDNNLDSTDIDGDEDE